MFTIIDEYMYEFEEKKSKFISFIFPINSTSDFEDKLSEIKDKYRDATHYVYAYRIIDTGKINDDGEPGGTGGLPIMNVIEKEKLYKIGIVVVRYFGGTKLGAGGLIRAYSKASSKLINKEYLKELVKGKLIELKLDYNMINDIDYLINKTNSNLVNKNFDNDITYLLEVSNDNLDLFNKYNYEIKKDTMLVI